METSTELIKSLKARPDVKLLIQRLENEMNQEIKERKKYYNLVHENINAEFINGEIVFHSPAKMQHWLTSMLLLAKLAPYVLMNKLGIVGSEKVMVSLTRNDYEPDICFFTKEKAKDFKKKQMQFPPPDFVVEILSPSTAKNDRGTKFIDYAAHGVSEYWIIDPEKETVEQYLLKNKSYHLAQKLKSNGVLKSKIVKGFEVEIDEIFENDFYRTFKS